jgi:GntR family transcriptional repressor for pyruvate dehydrogenase complex
MPSKVVRVSVIDEVVAQLEDAIAAGEYPPNTKLPGEADLAAQLGVSRPILREALARLRERGYVRTVNGRGTFAREPDLGAVSEALLRQIRLHVGTEVKVEDLYELRRTIETSTVQLASARANKRDLTQLQRHIESMQSAATDDPEAFAAADARFHVAIAQASHNPLYPLLLAPVVDLILTSIFQAVSRDPVRMQNGIASHIRIYESIAGGDSDGAVKEIQEHLKGGRDKHSAAHVAIATNGDGSWLRAVDMH